MFVNGGQVLLSISHPLRFYSLAPIHRQCQRFDQVEPSAALEFPYVGGDYKGKILVFALQTHTYTRDRTCSEYSQREIKMSLFHSPISLFPTSSDHRTSTCMDAVVDATDSIGRCLLPFKYDLPFIVPHLFTLIKFTASRACARICGETWSSSMASTTCFPGIGQSFRCV